MHAFNLHEYTLKKLCILPDYYLKFKKNRNNKKF